eukprot:s1235_g22.t1
MTAPLAPALTGIVPSPEPLPFTHVLSGRSGFRGQQPAQALVAKSAAVKLPSIKGRPVGPTQTADDSPFAPLRARTRRKSEESQLKRLAPRLQSGIHRRVLLGGC